MSMPPSDGCYGAGAGYRFIAAPERRIGARNNR